MTIPPKFATNDPDAWHALGIALAAIGDRVGAFTALRNAALLDGNRASTQLALGNLFFDTGRLDDALRCFECVTASGPTQSPGETSR
jgi:Flp pilus assembly protein TadD